MAHWIYAAVLIAIASGVLGIAVGGLVLRRVVTRRETPPPVIAWLLLVLVLLSIAQVMEQARVLVFRLSYDGVMPRWLFTEVYAAAWNVVSSKVLAAVALTTGAAVKLGLYCNKPDSLIVRWAVAAAVGTLGAWTLLAYVIDDVLH
jgi:hypothetical protein